MLVATILTGAAAGAGALFGFVIGVVAQLVRVTAVSSWLVVVLLALTVVLDRFLPPLSVRRQVPQLWGRIFSARTTALLYGARLGVGPLTILRTWWWWLAVVLGALVGVWESVIVGAVFGGARIAVMLAAGTRAGAMRHRERLTTFGAVGVASALAVGVLAAPASSSSDGGVVDRGPAVTIGDNGERAHRESTNTTTTSAPVSTVPVTEDPALAAELPEEIGNGFSRVDDEAAGVGALDLAAAAAAEADESAERALLETRHFQRGHARVWRDGRDRLAYAAVYRFASAADADAYLVDGFITLESRGARVYDVTDVSGGRGFSQAGSDAAGGEVAHGVAFVRGDSFFLVFVSARDSSVEPADAAAVALAVDAFQARP